MIQSRSSVSRRGRAGRLPSVVAATAALTAAASLLAALGLAGCGSGGSQPLAGGSFDAGNPALTRATGQATFTVRWPERVPGDSRLIPAAANAIKVRLTDPTGAVFVAEKVLVRPADGGATTATFPGLPVGSLLATASAHPTQSGDGVAQAAASAPVTVAPGANTPLTLTMASTIATLEIAPAVVSLAIGGAQSLVATAKNAAGEVVLTSPARLRWESSAGAVARVDDGGKVSGVGGGSATVTATETESGKSATAAVTVSLPGQNVREVNLRVNDIVYDPGTGKLYVSVPSSAGAEGNSIRSIDPNTLQVGPPVFVGSEPGPLAISDDGKYLYIGLNGAPRARRYVIATGALDLDFPLVSGGGNDAYYAEQIEVQPGNSAVIAVSRRNVGYSPRHEGVIVYENGVPRANRTPDHTGSNVIEFGADPGRIYGYNNETTGYNFFRLTVDGNGVSVQDSYSSFDGDLLSGFSLDIEYDNGRVYATSGRVIDPEARQLLGTFPAGGAVRPDSALGRVFFLSGGSYYGSPMRVRTFDPATYQEVTSMDLPGVTGTGGSFVRWGAKGLAFRVTGDWSNPSYGKVYIVANAPGT